jgi:acetylornithine deacetylase
VKVQDLPSLRHEVAGRREDLFGLASQLVRIPTVLGAEEEAQRLIHERLERAGFQVQRIEPDANAALADPTAGYPALSYDGRSSVVARLPGSGAGRSLHLNGHVDVVPVEHPDTWQHDPWGGEIAGGRLWGRGAGDMKSGLAAIVVAAEILAGHCPDRRGELIVSSVIEEECGGNGMWSVLRAGHHGDATLIAEPSGLCLDFAGTGVVWARLIARSPATHAASAGRRGAFDELAGAVAAVRRLETERNSPPRDEVFAAVSEWPFGTSIGMIEGGVWPSSTPEELTAHVRIGFGRDTEPEEVQKAVVDAVAQASERVTVQFAGFRAHAYCHDHTGPWPELVGSAHESVIGGSIVPAAITATSDARYPRGPCVNYGPIAGGIHGADEWVDLASLEQAATVIVLAAATWLRADAG